MKSRKFITTIKYFFFGLVLLFLFHFETLYIGPIKISHAWKGLVLVFLLISLLRRDKNIFFIYKPLIAIATLQLFSIEVFVNPINAVLLFATILILPLFGIYVLKYSTVQLQKALLFITSFFILSFIPYKLGLIASLGDIYNLNKYGGRSEGLIGAFQGAHPASIALAGSFLVILYFWFIKAYSRPFLTVLLALGFYFLINTYVRTGMAMVVIGVLPMIFYFGKKEKSSRFRLIAISGFLALLTALWVMNNEVLLKRIIGEDKYYKEDSFETVGSGRGLIYLTNIEIFSEAKMMEKVFGIGQTELIKRTENKIGKSLLSHNGFLQILISNGIIGFVFFLIYIRSIYKLKKRLFPNHFVIIFSLLLAFVTMSLVQGYDIIYFHILMMLCIPLYVQESYMFNNLKKATLKQILKK
ncbi:O-antigen ligase family protein [Winogradskyella ursingii]|uniref:O-antigen ligase family protein n=1 Tax=Winogradskyella ursingii TaxID=2686079 RepID=UPI0015CA9BF9|nr:O-antigen ligase family protein [Winogradskyella ursingii]